MFMLSVYKPPQSAAFPDEDEKALLLRPGAGPSSSKPPSPTPRCQPPLAVSAVSTAAMAAAAAAASTAGARSSRAMVAAVWQQAAAGVAEASEMTDALPRPTAAPADGSLTGAASVMTGFASLPVLSAAIVEPISFPPTEEGYASKVRT